MTERIEWLGNAEIIVVNSDEDGWELLLTTDRGRYGVNIHGVSEQLPEQAQKIADYWAEGRAAAASHVPPVDPDGYDRSDPKHPDWHSVHADLWDARENK